MGGQETKQLTCTWNPCEATEKCGDGEINGPEECDGEEGCNDECTWDPVKIHASKIICDNEMYLPDWGDKYNDAGDRMKITKSTAQEYVDQSDGHCWLAEGWKFQWGDVNAGNHGDNNGESTNPKWHTFGPTGSNGTTRVKIPYQDVNNFWMREILQDGYVEFAGGNAGDENGDAYSAEMYCHIDTYKYDNYERVDGPKPGHSYYCVAFNVEKTYCGDSIVQTPNDYGQKEECDSNEEACVADNGYNGTKTCYMDDAREKQDMCTWNECVPTEKCGDDIKNGPEECDGTHGITEGENFCNAQCELVPIYDGGHACSEGKIAVKTDLGKKILGTNPSAATINTANGQEYLFEVSGTYQYANNADRQADGAYATVNNWSSLRTNIGAYGTEYRGVTSLLSDMSTGIMGVIDWGEYNPDHVYTKRYVPTGPTEFVVSDWYSNWYNNDCSNQSCFGDNSGSLDLTVYECKVPSYIQGKKFNDENGNGTREKSEPFMNDWTVRLYNSDWNQVDSGHYTGETGILGQYRFEGLGLGTYYVCEVQQEGWTETRPSSVANQSGAADEASYCFKVKITKYGKGYTEKQFGNQQLFDINGYKWNDINSNGERDCQDWGGDHQYPIGWGTPECEPKLEDWTIFIDENGNGILDNEEQNTTTDEGGNYKFESLLAGTYTVCEVQQDGWTQTYPENCHEVTLPTPLVSAACEEIPIPDQMFNFGNYQAYCGNLIVDEGEECDGNVEGYGQYCSETCTIEEIYTLTKTDNKDTAEPGEFSTYEITFGYTTEWPDPLTTGYIIDTVPDNFTVDEATISDSGVYDDPTRTITWQIDEMIETPHTFTFSGMIDAEMPEGTTILLNTAKLYQQPMLAAAAMVNEMIVEKVIEPEPILLLTATDETTVNPNPVEMSIAKSVDKDIASHGDLVTYEITATNAKDTETCNEVTLTITDDITDVLVDASLVSTDAASQDGNVLTWVFEGVACGETVTGEVVVEVLADSYHGAVIENIAWVRDSNGNSVTSQLVATEISAPTVILDLSKTVNKLLANPLDALTYTVVLNNSGNTAAANVTLTDVLPAGLTFANEDGSNSGDTEKTWTWDSLGVGQDITMEYDVLVDSKTADGAYVNTATASADNHGEISDTAATEIVTPKVEGAETPSLSIVKTVTEKTANPNQTVNYSVTITNDGGAVAFNAVLTDTLPQGLVYAGTETQTEAKWKLGDIVPNESTTIKYQATVLSNVVEGAYTNTATVIADDTPKVSDTADIDVVLIKVLGAEIDEDAALPVTGPQAQHYLYFILAGILIAGSLFAIKFTSSKEKS